MEWFQEMLKGKISEELCRYIEKFERLCKKEKTEKREVATEVNIFELESRSREGRDLKD